MSLIMMKLPSRYRNDNKLNVSYPREIVFLLVEKHVFKRISAESIKGHKHKLVYLED